MNIRYLVTAANKILYCSINHFIGDFLSLCFWSVQLVISVIRLLRILYSFSPVILYLTGFAL